jgi:hypothetical protein
MGEIIVYLAKGDEGIYKADQERVGWYVSAGKFHAPYGIREKQHSSVNGAAPVTSALPGHCVQGRGPFQSTLVASTMRAAPSRQSFSSGRSERKGAATTINDVPSPSSPVAEKHHVSAAQRSSV